MGTSLKVLLLSLLFTALCGCSQTVEQPYTFLGDNTYSCGDVVWENGVSRNKLPTDAQALQYVTDGTRIDLVPGDLAFYSGSLYSLSNYRKLLLEEGYIIESETRSPILLDTTLNFGGDRVRLIYQSSGSIRILFENQEGFAHILLKGDLK